MIHAVLRHWMLLDLNVFRRWATDDRVRMAYRIDNLDGTIGRAFDVRTFPPEGVLAVSDTMALAMLKGMQAVAVLPSCAPRIVRQGPSLQELVARAGGYNRVTSAQWAKHDRDVAEWQMAVRYGEADIE